MHFIHISGLKLSLSSKNRYSKQDAFYIYKWIEISKARTGNCLFIDDVIYIYVWIEIAVNYVKKL